MERLMERLKNILFYCFVVYVFISLYGTFRDAWAISITQTEFNITSGSYVVNWFETELDLQAELGEFETGGMAICEWRPEFNHSFCEFWLVEPTELDTWTQDFEQDVWKTIGHEFYHATKGTFHNE